MLWCKRQIDLRTKTLSQDCLFRFVLIFGVSLASILAVIIIIVEYDSLIFLCDSSKCFSGVLEVFKFPISFLAGVFAVAGFVAVIFRSQQTAIQIQEVINQNNFKNYIDHKKQFMEMLKGFEDQHAITFFNKEEFYLELFPFNSPKKTEFTSCSKDSKASILVFHIKAYNEKLSAFNLISQKLDQTQLAQWLAGFVLGLASLHIRFDKAGTVSLPFRRYFSSDKNLQKYPKDLDDAFYRLEEVFKAFYSYCIPSAGGLEIQQLVTFNNEVVTTLLEGIASGTTYE